MLTVHNQQFEAQTSIIWKQILNSAVLWARGQILTWGGYIVVIMRSYHFWDMMSCLVAVH